MVSELVVDSEENGFRVNNTIIRILHNITTSALICRAPARDSSPTSRASIYPDDQDDIQRSLGGVWAIDYSFIRGCIIA